MCGGRVMLLAFVVLVGRSLLVAIRIADPNPIGLLHHHHRVPASESAVLVEVAFWRAQATGSGSFRIRYQNSGHSSTLASGPGRRFFVSLSLSRSRSISS